MTQKIKLKVLLIFSLVLVLSVYVAFKLNAYNSTVLADSIETELNEEYFYGETIDIPSAELTLGTQKYNSEDSVVFYPDGKAQKTSRLTLSQHGLYKVRYYATIDSGKVYQEEEFIVKKDLVSFNSAMSSYYVGNNDEYNCSGLNLSISTGDEAKINKILDLSGADFKNSFMKFLMTPLELGTPDAYMLYLKLTDIYDSENYVIIRMQNWSDMGSWANRWCYIDARAPGQEWTSSVTKEGNVHKRGETGKGWYLTPFSFTGTNEENKLYSEPMELFFDMTEKQFLTSHNNYASKYGNTCMVDLDDPQWYNLLEEELWKGFTTGECYASFYTGSPLAASVNLCIYNIAGMSFNSLDNDTKGPDITVSCDMSNIPFAIVGESYDIFKAKAYDIEDAKVEVISNVFYDYNGTNKTIIDINNGSFTPKKAGIYTIVYKAKDLSGNSTVKTVNVEAKEEVEEAVITLKNSVKAINLGSSAQLFSDINVENSNGDYEIDVSVYKGNNNYKPDKNYVFTPDRIGKYTVVITVEDYVKTYEKSFDFEVINTTVPKFNETISLPKYFIKDAKYKLPELNGDIYIGNDLQKIKADCFCEYEGEERLKITSGYVPNKSGKVKIIYEVNNEGSIVSQEFDCLVVDTGYGNEFNIEKYFHKKTVNGQMTAKSDHIEFLSSTNSEFEFINAVQASELKVEFKVDGQKNAFNTAYFWLVDSADDSIRIKIRYENYGNKSKFYLNESELYIEIDANFNDKGNVNFILDYDNRTRLIKSSDAVSIIIDEDYYGNKFGGFPSGKVYVSVGMDGVEGESAIILKKLNNHNLYEQTKDGFKPQIILATTMSSLAQNEIYTIKMPVIADVFDPDITYSIEVCDPDGEYMTSIDGVKLDGTCEVMREYQIKLEKLGDYTIDYSAKDNAAYKPVEFSFGISVEDKNAPEIKFVDVIRTANKGDTVNIAKLEVKDDVTAECTVRYTVLRPDNRNEVVTNSFIVDLEGEYIVYAYVFDAVHNTSFATYTIVVK